MANSRTIILAKVYCGIITDESLKDASPEKLEMTLKEILKVFRKLTDIADNLEKISDLKSEVIKEQAEKIEELISSSLCLPD